MNQSTRFGHHFRHLDIDIRGPNLQKFRLKRLVSKSPLMAHVDVNHSLDLNERGQEYKVIGAAKHAGVILAIEFRFDIPVPDSILLRA